MEQRVPRLSLDLLRGFRAAARHLSFTRAAEELSVTQGAISREVRTLEEQLGQPLFVRNGRTLQLTQAGQALYEAVDEGLARIDAASARIAGASRSLAVTTTVALASTWLVPRLPRFAALHPDIAMRLFASNDALDLAREHLDLALRFALDGTPPPSAEKLLDYWQFPVCSPSLAADASRPLRAVADLSRHVLLDFETQLYGKPWYDWDRWFGAMKTPRFKTAGELRFSHYDQVIDAASRGSGVAVGKLPHLVEYLHDGRLVAPLGEAAVVHLGAFFIEPAKAAPAEAVHAFAAWLRSEAQRDAQRGPAVARRWGTLGLV